MEVEDDLLVYSLGTELEDGGVLTVVVPRAELNRFQLQFSARTY